MPRRPFALLVLAAISSCACGHAAADGAAFRVLPGLDLRAFDCAAAPGAVVIRSPAELPQATAHAASCSPEQARTASAALRRGLAAADVHWSREALVVVADVYGGSGMAKPHLEISTAAPDSLEARVVWALPPPPLTPDTAHARLAFAVDAKQVRTVTVVTSSGRSPLAVGASR